MNEVGNFLSPGSWLSRGVEAVSSCVISRKMTSDFCAQVSEPPSEVHEPRIHKNAQGTGTICTLSFFSHGGRALLTLIFLATAYQIKEDSFHTYLRESSLRFRSDDGEPRWRKEANKLAPEATAKDGCGCGLSGATPGDRVPQRFLILCNFSHETYHNQKFSFELHMSMMVIHFILQSHVA